MYQNGAFLTSFGLAFVSLIIPFASQSKIRHDDALIEFAYVVEEQRFAR